jgi:N-acetylneuraminic acid mutarotase
MRYRLRLRSLLILSALGLGACGEEATQPNTPEDQPTLPQFAMASNTWLTRRNMPLDMLYQATAVVPNAAGQSILYVFGGAKPGGLPGAPTPMGEVRAYNVATNSWAWKRDMPAVRYEMNAGVIGGKIYVPGGFTKLRKPTASLYVYDPASDTWSRKRDMPVPGGAGATGVIAGKLYVVTFNVLFSGGPSGVANFFRYDPAKDSWTKLASPGDYSRIGPGGAGVINNKLYLIGGARPFGDTILEYDPATNQWTKRASWSSQLCLPECGLEGRTVVMLGRLYLFGTELLFDTAPVSSGVFIYDPVSNNWQKKPLLTKFAWQSAYGLAATRVFLNGQPRVEVVGGVLGWPGSPGNNQQYIP